MWAQHEAYRRRPHLQLPWESGVLGYMLGSGRDNYMNPLAEALSRECRWTGPIPEDHSKKKRTAQEIDDKDEETIVRKNKWKTVDGNLAYRRPNKQALPWKEVEEGRLSKALARWKWIVDSADPGHCALALQLAKCLNPKDAEEVISNTFGLKAAGTLERRGGSIGAFVRWSQTATVEVPVLPFREATVYLYVEELRSSNAAATKAIGFIEAVPFTAALLGLPWPKEVLESARIKGAVWRSYATKRETVQAPPFTVEAVEILELMSITAPTVEERIIAGSLCFCIHSRKRGADAVAIIHEPVLEVDSDGEGFLESTQEAGSTKAGKSRKRLKKILPGVAFAKGISGTEWAREWLEHRKDEGLDASVDGCLILVPAPGGGFSDARATAEDMTVWMRELLIRGGLSKKEAATYTSRSCRATALSWAAKAAIPKSDRRLLGYHAKKGDTTMLEYSRDALAGPLRQLEQVYLDIRHGRFQPDVSRSGRWKKAARDELLREMNAAKGDQDPDSLSSSSSSAEELEKESLLEQKERDNEVFEASAAYDTEILGSERARGYLIEEDPDAEIYMSTTGCLHLSKPFTEESPQHERKLACYRNIGFSYKRRESWGPTRTSVCDTCMSNSGLELGLEFWPPRKKQRMTD